MADFFTQVTTGILGVRISDYYGYGSGVSLERMSRRIMASGWAGVVCPGVAVGQGLLLSDDLVADVGESGEDTDAEAAAAMLAGRLEGGGFQENGVAGFQRAGCGTYVRLEGDDGEVLGGIDEGDAANHLIRARRDGVGLRGGRSWWRRGCASAQNEEGGDHECCCRKPPGEGAAS